MEKKVCKNCKKETPLAEFYPRSDKHGDGYFTWCIVCERQRYKQKYWRNIVKERLRGRKKYLLNREKVFNHYGYKCICCGERESIFLSIDHVNGKGTMHRKQTGNILYVWLRLNNYPEGFQVLCHNCNWAKAHGDCPHQI